MSKLTRIAQKIFGSSAGVDQIAQFGSLLAGSPAFTTDPATAMALSNWLTGWFGAAISGNAPAIEDMNAAFYVLTYQLAYVLQAGVPEWDSATAYYIGSFANIAGVTYVSRTDGNVNHDPSADATNWKVIGGDLMTALGDLVYGGAAGKSLRLAGNTDARRKYFSQKGDGAGSSEAPSWHDFTPPNIIEFKSGATTYTPNPDAVWVEFEGVGAGGGGSGGGTTGAGDGGNGGSTTIGTLITAGGGVGGHFKASGGNGGAIAVGAAAQGPRFDGAKGQGGGVVGAALSFIPGGNGASTPFGGAGMGGEGSANGYPAVENTGSGGGGAGAGGAGTDYAGPGGGAGAYFKVRVNRADLDASYLITIGVKGAGGAAGTSGLAGGPAADGYVCVTEHFN